ncbi:hypothetical protein CA984_42940 [Streptosporangium minutum]|uniref:Uncharacterized protein n=1 Tax=Streptosporangium minutum TaxID=569862 RepID=A0A2C9ZJ70_9ACTN|nr:hypothetical protein CA984_42940 [Streptosporangium minutum]
MFLSSPRASWARRSSSGSWKIGREAPFSVISPFGEDGWAVRSTVPSGVRVGFWSGEGSCVSGSGVGSCASGEGVTGLEGWAGWRVLEGAGVLGRREFLWVCEGPGVAVGRLGSAVPGGVGVAVFGEGVGWTVLGDASGREVAEGDADLGVGSFGAVLTSRFFSVGSAGFSTRLPLSEMSPAIFFVCVGEGWERIGLAGGGCAAVRRGAGSGCAAVRRVSGAGCAAVERRGSGAEEAFLGGADPVLLGFPGRCRGAAAPARTAGRSTHPAAPPPPTARPSAVAVRQSRGSLDFFFAIVLPSSAPERGTP